MRVVGTSMAWVIFSFSIISNVSAGRNLFDIISVAPVIRPMDIAQRPIFPKKGRTFKYRSPGARLNSSVEIEQNATLMVLGVMIPLGNPVVPEV